jgi:hypothetical protein
MYDSCKCSVNSFWASTHSLKPEVTLEMLEWKPELIVNESYHTASLPFLAQGPNQSQNNPITMAVQMVLVQEKDKPDSLQEEKLPLSWCFKPILSNVINPHSVWIIAMHALLFSVLDLPTESSTDLESCHFVKREKSWVMGVIVRKAGKGTGPNQGQWKIYQTIGWIL